MKRYQLFIMAIAGGIFNYAAGVESCQHHPWIGCTLALAGGYIVGDLARRAIRRRSAGRTVPYAAFAWRAWQSSSAGAELFNRALYGDSNPRCFCPDCGAYLGHFYCNRIRMEEVGNGN